MNPGIKNKTFKIQLDIDAFHKGEIIEQTINNSNSVKLKVIKVYKFTWWKKILFKLGFSIKFFQGILVEQL